MTAPAGLSLSTAAGRWVLLATVLGSALASIDATVVGIALPAIGKEFTVGLSSLQWTVTAYTLTLAGLLLVAGALGDRFGRRRVFVIGIVWFAGASLLCAVAPDPATLIAARALQGVGGALLTPGSLAILQTSFIPADRGRAIGAWSGLGGVATAVGPFVGGWLVQAASWRFIFFINLPLAVAVVAIALRHVPESRANIADARVDVFGGLLVTAGLVGVTFGLIEGAALGWSSAEVVTALVAGTVLLLAFLAHERRTSHPILPLGLFGARQFTATNAVTFVVYGALGGALFLVVLRLQLSLHYSALEAGAAMVPFTALMLLLSPRAGALAQRIGPR
ncbi:MAG: hypothetical protein QOJ03_2457, partial [Frankiaceae bacterium]|nr:hypothetical protein [Frankiaceae bacterium]